MSDANHPRDRVREKCAYMPGVTRGRFVVYPRTDGRFVVVDPLRPWNARDVPGTLSASAGKDGLREATAHADRCALLHPGDFVT